MPDTTLRNELARLLTSDKGHVTFEQAINGLPAELQGIRPTGVPYSCWEQLEHVRICQADILHFLGQPDRKSPPSPDGFWPLTQTPPSPDAWQKSISEFQTDRDTIIKIIHESELNPCDPLPRSQGQTLLGKVLLLADHNAYHFGQIVMIRRALGAWEPAAN